MKTLTTLMTLAAFWVCACGKSSDKGAPELPATTPSTAGVQSTPMSPMGRGVHPPAKVATLGQVVLLDVQPLFGGRDLWINSDGKGECRVIAPSKKKGRPGLWEQRYAVSVDKKTRDALLRLINARRFFTLRTRHRPGVPDEARPVIFVRVGDTGRAVGKWANDVHEDFDAIYKDLKGIVDKARAGRPIHEGAFVQEYVPKGFPRRSALRK